MSDILIYEPRQEGGPHLALIMILAQLSFSVARNQNEQLYYVNAYALQLMTFQLLLFHQLPRPEDARGINLVLQSLLIPALYVQRDGQSLTKEFDERLIACRPDDMLNRIETCLVNSTHEIKEMYS